MDAETLHELSAAYALDALDDAERESFEQHLAGCERCRADVADFSSVSGSLAFAVEPAVPPPALKERILVAARAERPNVVPLRPRWAYPVAAVAAVAACAVVGLGLWNISLHDRLGGEGGQAIQRVAVSGASNSFVVYSGHSAGLVLSGVDSAPSGKTYEAWVIHGKTTSPAGLFAGGRRTTYVPLTRRVAKGSIVAVTLEPAGGSAQPTTKPFVVSSPV
ncbi:MAG TPA: anti-sigma factor [Gaiellaceae bacterium]|jgi:anti-sigma-K factor RskA|nr:anti-sigma factor [Gaiellaceae bacterium]